MCVYVPTGGGLGKGGRAVEEEEEEEESCIESKHFPSSPSPLLILTGFGLKGREEQVLREMASTRSLKGHLKNGYIQHKDVIMACRKERMNKLLSQIC